MPKATSKSSPRTPPKPRAVRSPKKKSAEVVEDDEDEDAMVSRFTSTHASKASQPALVDVEAEESDDGVLVDRAETDERELRGLTDSEDEYDKGFINDGDPFVGADGGDRQYSSPEITPPPSTAKPASVRTHFGGTAATALSTTPKRGSRVRKISDEQLSTPSPPKRAKRAVKDKDAAVIEVDNTSDEDLEAMAPDDSNFKRPVRLRKELPPSLLTRSAAKKSSPMKNSDLGSPSGSRSDSRLRGLREDPLRDIPEEMRIPPFVVDGAVTPAARTWISALKMYNSGRDGSAFSKSPSTNSRKQSQRVDYDELALNEALQNSIHDGVDTPSSAPQRYSPDWEFPPPEDLRPASMSKTKQHAGSSPTKMKTDTDSSAKGKGKASSASAKLAKQVPALQAEDIDGDAYPASEWADCVLSTLVSSRPKGKAFLTMAQFVRLAQVPSAETDESVELPEEDAVFMSDFASYKLNFDPEAPCGVTDPAIQDPILRGTYVGVCPLPRNKYIVPVFQRSRSSVTDVDPETGGRISFSSWGSQTPRMIAENAVNALTFVFAEPNYINLSRATPLKLEVKPTGTTNGGNARLFHGKDYAICVSAICSAESFLVTPQKLGASGDFVRKSLTGIMHDQEWERFASLACLVFGQDIMYGQMTEKSIAFQSIGSTTSQVSTSAPNLPSGMFSASRSPSKGFASSRQKFALECDDPVPVYDARKTRIDFQTDLPRLATVLDGFKGEIPAGSFCVVGYTCSTWSKVIANSPSPLPHIGLNILWVIVCGTPGTRP